MSAPVLGEVGLLGRDADLRDLAECLSTGRMVTVSGPGGVGKTSLAAAFAAGSAERYPGGTRWVDLASADERGVAAAVVGAIDGEAVGVEPLDAAIAALGEAPTLLVVDSCEHVADEVARVAGVLLRGCRTVRVLATSRVPLGVGGEHVLRLAPLAVAAASPAGDDEAGPAVALFVRRATEAGGAVLDDASSHAAVVEICRRLDGLPLAIELAASLVRVLPVTDIAARLDDRFRLLRTSRRDGDVRHHSLADVITWSYELLEPDDRDLLDRVAVFPGSFSLQGAHDVRGAGGDEIDTLERITRLVDHSMVVAVGERDARYALLETVREFGRANLAAGPSWAETHERLIDHVGALAEAAAIGMRGVEEGAWVRRIDDDLPTVVAAFRWAADRGQVERCLRLVVALFEYAFNRIRTEVGVLASEAVRLPGAAGDPGFAEAAAVAAYLEWQRGLAQDAEDHVALSLQAGDTWLGYDARGTISIFLGDVGAAIAAYDKAAELVGSSAYLTAITESQRAFAGVYAGRDDVDVLAARAEAAAAESGSPTALAQAAWASAITVMERDPELALARLERSMDLASSVRNRLGHGAASVPAQELRTRLERRSPADDVRRALGELDYMHGTGNDATAGVVLRRLVWGLAEVGLLEQAVVASGAEERASLNLPMRPRERERHGAVLGNLAASLGRATYEQLRSRGHALTADEVRTFLAVVADEVDRRAADLPPEPHRSPAPPS